MDNLKIDMSFIRNIVEGVEAKEQWKIMRLLKCDMIQGFYMSMPASPLLPLLICHNSDLDLH